MHASARGARSLTSHEQALRNRAAKLTRRVVVFGKAEVKENLKSCHTTFVGSPKPSGRHSCAMSHICQARGFVKGIIPAIKLDNSRGKTPTKSLPKCLARLPETYSCRTRQSRPPLALLPVEGCLSPLVGALTGFSLHCFPTLSQDYREK